MRYCLNGSRCIGWIGKEAETPLFAVEGLDAFPTTLQQKADAAFAGDDWDKGSHRQPSRKSEVRASRPLNSSELSTQPSNALATAPVRLLMPAQPTWLFCVQEGLQVSQRMPPAVLSCSAAETP